MAAEGYARITRSPGVLNVTTGPGGINALNGVFGAWTDSIPMLILSGQVKRETCMATYGLTDLRQLGDQEVEIVRMVRGITKYAVFVEDPETIAYHLERAWYLAQNGRPGPCWLDIPVDVQSAQIDPASLRHSDPSEDALVFDPAVVTEQVADVLSRIGNARALSSWLAAECEWVGHFRNSNRYSRPPYSGRNGMDTRPNGHR